MVFIIGIFTEQVAQNQSSSVLESQVLTEELMFRVLSSGLLHSVG